MKKKIAVIGGGLGSLATMYYLMNLPNAKDLYDITLYQQNWQLGGKGASGVNQEKGCRVEEHGIHFWFGFYENGFHLMKDVYAQLNRPKGYPVATFEQAFKAQPSMDFAQQVDGQWTDWKVDFPSFPGTLGDGIFISPIEEMIYVGFQFLADEFHKIIEHLKSGCLGIFIHPFRRRKKAPIHATHEAYLAAIEKELAKTIQQPIERRLRALGAFYKDPQHHQEQYKGHHIAHLNATKAWIWDEIGHLVASNPKLLRIWCLLDFGFAVLKGIIEDGVLYAKDDQFYLDFSKINHYDFTEWLILHGADKNYINSNPLVKSMYDGPFAFFRGAVSTPNVEAGTALNIFFRLAFTCKENAMFRMQGGMGDIVFAPIYQYFKKEFPENVHFEFFHQAENLVLSKDKCVVESIVFDRLIDLKEGVLEYDPLIQVKGFDCWPSEPLFDQLNQEQSEEIKKRGINISSDWSGWTGTEVIKTRGEDFDDLVIGASLGALPTFCDELITQNGKWARMLDGVGTVQTQAFQIWLTKSPEELSIDPQKILSTYVEPLDTFAEMNQVLNREGWPETGEKPKCLLYVCGAFLDSGTIPPPDAGYFPTSQHGEIFDNMRHYVKHDLKFIIPKAFDANGQFDWNLLYDPTGQVGEDRLKYQYFRANIDTTERYVYSLKGSSKFRLKANESGFDNVFLTGDWIQNGMNIGFVEGATISGILAARAVSGDETIPLYVPW